MYHMFAVAADTRYVSLLQRGLRHRGVAEIRAVLPSPLVLENKVWNRLPPLNPCLALLGARQLRSLDQTEPGNVADSRAHIQHVGEIHGRTVQVPAVWVRGMEQGPSVTFVDRMHDEATAGGFTWYPYCLPSLLWGLR